MMEFKNLKSELFKFKDLKISPFVHPIVNYGIHAAVGHCQPIESQVHVLGVPGKILILCEFQVLRSGKLCKDVDNKGNM